MSQKSILRVICWLGAALVSCAMAQQPKARMPGSAAGQSKPASQPSQQTAVTQDGKTVILKSDGTWRYAKESPAAEQPPPEGRTVTPGELFDILTKAIWRPSARNFALCNMQPAFWAKYDVAARVGSDATADGRGHIFRLTRGRFLDSIDGSIGSRTAEFKRTGLAVVKDKEEAFRNGLQFFIHEVAVKPPDSLSFSVTAAPDAQTTHAKVRRESYGQATGSGGTGLFVASSAWFDRPADQATMKFTDKISKDSDEVLAIVVSMGDGVDCLVSNEVPLGPLVKESLAPKP